MRRVTTLGKIRTSQQGSQLCTMLPAMLILSDRVHKKQLTQAQQVSHWRSCHDCLSLRMRREQ